MIRTKTNNYFVTANENLKSFSRDTNRFSQFATCVCVSASQNGDQLFS